MSATWGNVGETSDVRTAHAGTWLGRPAGDSERPQRVKARRPVTPEGRGWGTLLRDDCERRLGMGTSTTRWALAVGQDGPPPSLSLPHLAPAGLLLHEGSSALRGLNTCHLAVTRSLSNGAFLMSQLLTADQEIESEAWECKNGTRACKFCRLHPSQHS